MLINKQLLEFYIQDSDKSLEHDYKKSESYIPPPKKDKLREVLEKEIKTTEKEPEAKESEDKDKIIIEDIYSEKEIKLEQKPNFNIPSTNTSNSFSNIPMNNLDPSTINEAKEKIKNMVRLFNMID